MATSRETNVRTASTQEDMKCGTAKTDTSGGRRGGDSHSDDGRLGEFVLLAELKVTSQF
jgi:lipoyl-dependent peroxiredoxin